MKRYRIQWSDDDTDDEETFETFEAAREMAEYYQACAEQGAEDFYLSNPGDYPYDEDAYERPDFEIVEVSE